MNQEKISELEKTIAAEYGNIGGMIVMKNGRTLYEHYFNGCTANSTLHVYSVTKSILSLLFGIAIDKGYLEGVHQKVLTFFPEYAVREGETVIQDLTIQDLLTMTAPFQYEEAPYIEYFTSDDWVSFALNLLGGGPKGEFRYMPIVGPDILSGILVRATGKSVLDFASENLFAPLDITVKANVVFQSAEEQFAFNGATDISGWVADLKGVNSAGWGLTLTARDMAKLGQLCLDGGVWNGKQIISTRWIDESTQEHSRWKELDLPFGYLWWVENGAGFMAMGDSGNVIYVSKQKQMVISIASLFDQKAKDRIDFIKEWVEPVFDGM